MANQTREYGDLVVTMTSAFDWRWNDSGSGAKRDGAFWHPKPQGELRSLGSVAVPHYNDINNQWAVILVGDNPSNRPEGKGPAVQHPVDYQGIWNDAGSGAHKDGSFWRPVPPSGYLSVGDVAWSGHGKPDLDQVWCLRIDLVGDGGFKDASTWDDTSSHAKVDGSFWEIIPNVQSSDPKYVPVLAGTFLSNASHGTPPSSLARVPTFYLPKKDKALSPFPPAVTPDSIPQKDQVFRDTVQSTVALPFTSFFDPNDRACLDNIRDPFCTLSKAVDWIVLNIYPNAQSTPQTFEYGGKIGVTQSSSTTMTNSVGVSVTAESGLLVGKYSVTLNYQFTYSETESREEMRERYESRTFTVSPRTTSIAWGRHVSINGVRADGSRIGGGVSYTGDDFVVSDVPMGPAAA